MYPTFETFQAAVEAAGLQAVKRSPTHWQVIGRFRVNYYPAAKRGPTAYVNGTHAGTYCSSIADVVRMATEPPPVADRKARRKKNTKNLKLRLLRKNPHCYWCRAPLTRETATLEHIIPLARGGSNGSDNLTIACKGCNADRGHDMPEITSAEVEGTPMRAMSFALTTEQLLDGSKTVTRRLGWHTLQPGMRLRAVKRCMGLKKGERQEALAEIEVVSVRRERLELIDAADVVREGFPNLTPAEFVAMFCDHMRCKPSTVVTRIEFRKVEN